MIKILILSFLLYYVFRMIARFLTYPSRMNHDRENPRVFVYREDVQNLKNSPKEKDISDKGRVIDK